MTDAIVQWLLSAGEGKFLATVLISMLPVIELRGGLPAGVAMGLPLREAFFAALLGNLLPVPFIILFARDRKSTRLNSSHMPKSRMPSSA